MVFGELPIHKGIKGVCYWEVDIKEKREMELETKREKLKKLLLERTNCGIQHDGWPCNTCFHAMDLRIDDDKLHELWLSTLLIRGDYKNGEYFTQTEGELNENIDELIDLLKRDKK